MNTIVEKTENQFLYLCSIQDALNFARVCKLFNRVIEKHPLYQRLNRAKESIKKVNEAFKITLSFFCRVPLLCRIATWNPFADQEASQCAQRYIRYINSNNALLEIFQFCKNNKFNQNNIRRLDDKAQAKEALIKRYHNRLSQTFLLWNLIKGLLLAIPSLYLSLYLAKEVYGLSSWNERYKLFIYYFIESNVTQEFGTLNLSWLKLSLKIMVILSLTD